MIWNLHRNISNNKQDEKEQEISTASAIFVLAFDICLGFTKSTAAILVQNVTLRWVTGILLDPSGKSGCGNAYAILYCSHGNRNE